jgi:hypothetical protein
MNRRRLRVLLAPAVLGIFALLRELHLQKRNTEPGRNGKFSHSQLKVNGEKGLFRTLNGTILIPSEQRSSIVYNPMDWRKYDDPMYDLSIPWAPPRNISARWEDIMVYESPLNDRTIPYNPNVNRLWLQNETKLPPGMIMITSYGWNQANKWKARKWQRSKRQRELLVALTHHPWFHPTAWIDLKDGRLQVSNTTRYYVFLDMETCSDRNWPYYGQPRDNGDQYGGRGLSNGNSHEEELNEILASPVMSTKGSRVIVFDCNGYIQRKENQGWRRDRNQDERLLLVSVSANSSQHLPVDFGLPPPGCQQCELSHQQRKQVDTCNEEVRPYLLTFSGNFRSQVRQELLHLHNGRDVWIASANETAALLKEPSDPVKSFKTLASWSKFAAVPRGDNLFSYRFTEVMSCGAIPVVYADRWIFPFRKEIADPSGYAVIIAEAETNATLAILADISEDRRCRMRRRVLEVYETYMKTGEGTIRGIVESLEIQNSASDEAL